MGAPARAGQERPHRSLRHERLLRERPRLQRDGGIPAGHRNPQYDNQGLGSRGAAEQYIRKTKLPADDGGGRERSSRGAGFLSSSIDHHGAAQSTVAQEAVVGPRKRGRCRRGRRRGIRRARKSGTTKEEEEDEKKEEEEDEEEERGGRGPRRGRGKRRMIQSIIIDCYSHHNVNGREDESSLANEHSLPLVGRGQGQDTAGSPCLSPGLRSKPKKVSLGLCRCHCL